MIFYLFKVLNISYLSILHVGLGGLGVTSSPRDLRFVGSNPAEIDGFFHEEKSSGRDLKVGVPSLRFQAR